MKARPVRKATDGTFGYVECSVDEATHVTINMPGPTGKLTLPVILHGTRDGTGSWTWNGDAEKPTLRPSVLTRGHCEWGEFICHSWVNDGKAQFLEDSSHKLSGSTVDLLDVV